MTAILLRYSEIGLKSRPVRSRFERILIQNIEQSFLNAGLECIIERQFGRIFLYTGSGAGDFEKAAALLKRTFGIVSVSEVLESTAAVEDVCKAAAEYSKNLIKNGNSFGIRARRVGTHAYTSQEIAKTIGDAVWHANEGKNIRVDLTRPDVEIFVEVRNNKSYIFSRKVECAGGMPVGSQGKVVAELDSEDAIAAAWLIAKRGCRVIPVIFSTGSEGIGKNSKRESGGSVGDALPPKSQKYIDALRKWDVFLKSALISADDAAPKDTIRYRRLADAAYRLGASAIVSADTLAYMEKNGIETVGIPIFYPLVGMNAAQIDGLKRFIQKTD